MDIAGSLYIERLDIDIDIDIENYQTLNIEWAPFGLGYSLSHQAGLGRQAQLVWSPGRRDPKTALHCCMMGISPF